MNLVSKIFIVGILTFGQQAFADQETIIIEKEVMLTNPTNLKKSLPAYNQIENFYRIFDNDLSAFQATPPTTGTDTGTPTYCPPDCGSGGGGN